MSSKRRLQRPPNSFRDAEIQADRLGMPDMQITVGLWRKARDDALRPTGVQIGTHNLADKIAQALVVFCIASSCMEYRS